MQKIGQALFISLKDSQLSLEELDFIRKESPAGVTLFKRNIQSKEQTQALIQEIKSLTPDPLLVAVDCEGGLVNRFSHLGLEYPSPQELSSWKDEDIVKLAQSMGKDLKKLGFDLNFAPVVDLPIVKSQLLENRVFSDSPNLAKKKAGAFMEGLLKEGILPCLKHFPGHGGVVEDSHDLLPEDYRSLDELESQIQLFSTLYKKYPCAIMTAHIVFPNIEKTPASFSPVFLTEILKRRGEFKGLVFSDDIDMGALSDFSPGESFFSALQAGCDMVLSCQKNPYEILDYFQKNPLKKKELERKLKESQSKKIKLFKSIQSLKTF